MPVKEKTVNLGYQQIVSPATATKLTVTRDAKAARIQAEAQSIRWRDDGIPPTATAGMLLAAGSDMYYDGEFSKLQLIQAAAGGIVNISYYA